MSHLVKLRERMWKELDDIAAKDTFCVCDLENAHKLIESICGLDTLTPAEGIAHAGKEKAMTTTSTGHLTMDQAKKWTASMKNADGTIGPHWAYEGAFQLMTQRKISCNSIDFWAALCMMYSDYCAVAREHGVDTPPFYADMAAAFLHDDDAVDDKLVAYWETIPADK